MTTTVDLLFWAATTTPRSGHRAASMTLKGYPQDLSAKHTNTDALLRKRSWPSLPRGIAGAIWISWDCRCKRRLCEAPIS